MENKIDIALYKMYWNPFLWMSQATIVTLPPLSPKRQDIFSSCFSPKIIHMFWTIRSTRPIHSINCRVNGIEARSLDKLSSEWAGPYTWHPIKWMGHRLVRSTVYRMSGPGQYARQFIEWMWKRPIHSVVHRVRELVSHSLNSLSIEWAWGIIKSIEELAAKN